MRLGSVRLVESPFMLDAKEELVRRTWRERLFSRPWQPFLKFRKIVRYVPSEKIVQIGNDLVVHPVLAQKIRETFDKEMSR